MTRTDEATDLLESLWHEEIRCGSVHYHGVVDISFCSTRAEWWMVRACDGVTTPWCSARFAQYQILLGGSRCMWCKAPSKDCWAIRPI